LVFLVILIEIVAGTNKEIIASSTDLLYLVIGEVVLPSANLRESE
jgi:hypothetical protein